MEIVEYIIILGFSISVISEIMTIITLYFQLTIKNLRKFPGILITIQCVAQMFYDLHWFSVLPQIKSWVFQQSTELCSTWGMLTMFFYFLGYNYATCLALEVVIKLKNGSNLSHKRRLIAYHSVSISISLAFCIVIYVFNGYGVSGLNTCSVNAENNIHLLEFFPFALNIPIIWYSVIYAIVNVDNKYKSVIINYVLIVTSVSVTWFFPTFFKLMVLVTGKDGNWTFIAFIIGTTSGLFVGLSRLLNKKVMKEIKKVITYRELKKINPRKGKVERNPQVLKLLEELNSQSEDYDFFTNFFELIGQNVGTI